MNRLMRFVIITLLFTTCLSLSAQEVNYSTGSFRIEPLGRINIAETDNDWGFRLRNFEELTIGNPNYRYYLKELKSESAQRFPRREAKSTMQNVSQGFGTSHMDDPVIMRNFEGNQYNLGVPNDNIIAVSNGGQLISAINTNIIFYDLNTDSLLKSMTLRNFSASLTGISTHQYDPKLLYDPDEDRFIIVFLAGASSDTKTDIVVGFSETNDMMGNWNVYSLPGNPLNDTSWTDFPAIALTRDELFITVNLLDYGTSWQTSFRQSVIWQVDKFTGYNGQTLNSKLWSNILFDGVNIRNLHPIQSGDKLLGPNIFLLSNRNFTLYSDSIFLLEITGNLNQQDAKLKITCLKSDVGYGAPPDARQPKTNMVLATNDARVLGGFIHNNTIQMVGNTIDTTTGSAVIYHGIISNVNRFPEVKLRLLTEPGMEYGYPNISYTGNTLFSQQSIIGFNHTGDSVHPGVSAVFYDGAGGYSNRVEIKTGEHNIEVLSGSYQRWGDYTGNQRKYDEPGTVWISGMFGRRVGFARRLGTQIAEITSPIAETPLVMKGRKLDAALYPNPVSDLFGMEFVMENSEELIIELRSMSGQRIHRFYEGPVSKGKNALIFSTQNLAQGVHILLILDQSGKVLFSEKVIKIKE